MPYVCFHAFTNCRFISSSFHKVAMGEEAIQINNLLLNVIRTYAARLNAMGVLLNRDYQAVRFCFH